MNDADYGYLKLKIRQLIDIDLDNYKPSQMIRRLDGFIARSVAPGVIPYCNLLKQSPDECEKLRNFLTINVSEFYRDISPFESLRTVILPELLKNNRTLNIWSAGCSDGQEPYTLAMLLSELSPFNKHRILATDIDKVSLIKGLAGGPYRSSDIKNLPPALVTKYFHFSEDGYRINENLRGHIAFKQHNLMQDPFENNFDLIICRNVVIYFSDEAKQKLKLRFFNSLKERGVLFIGATETMLDADAVGFQRMSTCFYRKFALTKNIPFSPSPAFNN